MNRRGFLGAVAGVAGVKALSLKDELQPTETTLRQINGRVYRQFQASARIKAGQMVCWGEKGVGPAVSYDVCIGLAMSDALPGETVLVQVYGPA